MTVKFRVRVTRAYITKQNRSRTSFSEEFENREMAKTWMIDRARKAARNDNAESYIIEEC